MRIITSILFLVFGTLCLSCGTTQEPGERNTDLELLRNCWVHVYEDDPGENSHVYQQCDLEELPPSRFRARYVLGDNGNCEYLYLAPTDGHHMVAGTWTYNEETKTVKVTAEDQSMIATFTVLELEDDRMLVRMQ